MAGKITEIVRVDVPGNGRRHAEPVQILPANKNRISLTLNVADFYNTNRMPPRVYIGYHPEGLDAETGYPILSTDGDLFLETVEAIYAFNPSNEDVCIRLISVE